MAGIGNLTILSLERYVFLGGSTKQKELIKRLQLPLIASVWVFALITSVPPILGWGRFVQDTFVSSCSFDFYSSDLNAQSYVMYLVTTGFLIPTSIIMSLYVKIYRKIRYYRKYLHQMLSENNDSSKFRFSFLESMKVVAKLQENEEISIRQHPKLSDEILLTDESYPQTARPTNQLNFQLEIPIVQRLALAEIEFAKQAFFAIIGYLICWSPYALLSVLCQTNVTTCYHPLASAITLMMAKTSVAINPIIYAFSDKGFLKSLRNRLTFKVTSFS